MFISRRWDEHKLFALGYAYEQVSASAIKVADRPCCNPSTELRDWVRRRAEDKLTAEL